MGENIVATENFFTSLLYKQMVESMDGDHSALIGTRVRRQAESKVAGKATHSTRGLSVVDFEDEWEGID